MNKPSQNRHGTYLVRKCAALLVGLVMLVIFSLAPPANPGHSAVQAAPRAAVFRGLKNLAAPYGIKVGVTQAKFSVNAPADSSSALFRNTIPSEFNSITDDGFSAFAGIHPCPPPEMITPGNKKYNKTVRNWVIKYGTDNDNERFHCTVKNAAADEWEYHRMDDLVNWAADNNIGVMAQFGIGRLGNPEWVAHPSVVLSKSELRWILRDHIRNIVRHYCSFPHVYAAVLLNEIFETTGGLRTGMVWDTVPDFVELSFTSARDELDSARCNRPDFKLFINDFQFEYDRVDPDGNSETTDNKATNIYNYLYPALCDPLKDQTCTRSPTVPRIPVDGFGMQTHLFMEIDPTKPPPHDTTAMVDTMDQFTRGLGVEMKITEADIVIKTGDPATSRNYYKAQGKQFRGIMEACMLALKCTGFTIWGSHDGSSWRQSDPKYAEYSDPLLFYDTRPITTTVLPARRLFDPATGACFTPRQSTVVYANKRFCPKPAYTMIADVLEKGVE